MPVKRDVAIILGSLRLHGIGRPLAAAVAKLAPPDLNLRIVEIGGLPLYNADLEAEPPQSWLTLRRQLRASDGFLFVTPEHNRSVPAALKNAIDIGSRPFGENSWAGKPAAIISYSPGAMGAFGANHHLRQSLVFLNVPAMQQPEAYIGNAQQLVGADGRIASESTRVFLSGFMASFASWMSLAQRASTAERVAS